MRLSKKIILITILCLFFFCMFYTDFVFSNKNKNKKRIILGHQLSDKAEGFLKKAEKMLGEIEFRDIVNHPSPNVRELDGCHDYEGEKHIVWLMKSTAPEFEQFMIHEIMHGILDKEGFPQTKRPESYNDEQSYNIGSILQSIILDIIIDNRLKDQGLAFFNRNNAIQNKKEDIFLDAQHANGEPYGYIFCKWALITNGLFLNNTITAEQKEELYKYTKTKFPEAADLGKKLSEEINKEGFSTPQKALNAMIKLRDSLQLKERVIVVDAKGNRF